MFTESYSCELTLGHWYSPHNGVPYAPVANGVTAWHLSTQVLLSSHQQEDEIHGMTWIAPMCTYGEQVMWVQGACAGKEEPLK